VFLRHFVSVEFLEKSSSVQLDPAENYVTGEVPSSHSRPSHVPYAREHLPMIVVVGPSRSPARSCFLSAI